MSAAGVRAPGAPSESCALLLGSGVQGLTCALRLWAQGWRVVVMARDALTDTPSWGAGAIWEYPPFQVEPQLAAERWVRATLGPLMSLATEGGGAEACGVRMRRSYSVFRDLELGRRALATVASPPGAVLDLREGLPPPGVLLSDEPYSFGFSYRAPVVCMSRYLPWMARRLAALGVVFVRGEVRSVGDVAAARGAYGAALVVNCLGLGAGPVFGDAAVHGVLGDLVYVRAPTLEDRFDLGHVTVEDHPDGLAYLVSQVGGIVALGGTSLLATAADADFGAVEARRAGIRKRCAEVFGPAAVAGEELGSWNGLRPQRTGGVRLELELGDPDLGPIIHNYGHGGSGVVTSWGCAEDVAALALQVAKANGCPLTERALPPDFHAAVTSTGKPASADSAGGSGPTGKPAQASTQSRL